MSLGLVSWFLGLPVGLLLERESELGSISTALSDARAGAGRLLLIEAGPGLGKSALLAVAARQASDAGMLVLRARGGENERALPFGGALQLFERLVLRVEEQQRTERLSGSAGLAAELFDAPATRRRLPDRDRALSIIHGLFWLTANLCEPPFSDEARPLALLVDDAHLLDDATLGFLGYLARRLEELPVALLVALRPNDSPPLAGLAALQAVGGEPLRLKELSQNAVEQLLRVGLGVRCAAPEFIDAVIGATDGNPFLVRELIHELHSEQIEPTAEQAPRVAAVAPASVLRAVVARLTRLPAAAAELAKAVAILGDGATTEIACALAGVEPESASAALDGLVAAGLFDASEPLRFAHQLIRAAISADITPAWRAAAELRAARLLAGAGEPPERVATHLQRAAPRGDEWVVQMLLSAAEHARARGAPEIAAVHLRRAVMEPPCAQERPTFLAALAEAEATAGLPDALEHLEQALELIEEPAVRAQLLGRVGRLLAIAGRHPEAVEAFGSALALVGGSESPLARELRAAMACAGASGNGSLEALRAVVDELCQMSAGSELPAERVALALAAAHGALAGRPLSEFRPLILRALRKGSQLGDPLSDAGLLLTPAAVALLYADELELSLKLLGSALCEAKAAGAVQALATASYLRAWPLYFTGAISEAIADAQHALGAREHGWRMHAQAACAILAHAQIERGDLEGALAALRDGASSDVARDEWATSTLLVAQGRLRLAEHDPAGALEALQQSARRIEQQGVTERPIAWRGPAALAALALGERRQALALAGEERERAEQIGVPRTAGMALRVCGLVEGGARGSKHLSTAAELLESSPSKLEHARALVDLGSLMRRSGARAACRDPLRRGLEMAERFGALPLARQAHDELLAAGARPRRVALSGLESLTPSERRIADLTAQGLTNREIAQQLFVTTKSVEYHLHHVFQKLDISSRKDVAPLLRVEEAAGQATPARAAPA